MLAVPSPRRIKSAVAYLVDQNSTKRCVDDILDELATVAPDRLNTLAVHLVVLRRVGPQQAGIPFLIHKQIWVVALLKLKLDRIDELRKAYGSLMR